MFQTAFVAAVVATATLAGGANAATYNGAVSINIYNYDPSVAGINSDATKENITAASAGGFLVGTVFYTGLIDFFTGAGTTPLISEFLDSGTGSYTGTFTDSVMSTGGFGITTLLDINGTFATAVSGVIEHDDGISLYDGFDNLIVGSASPTVSIDTPFSAGAGAFRLVYSAANGNPEELNIDVAPVPVPAAGLMLLAGLGGLATLRRRKAA